MNELEIFTAALNHPSQFERASFLDEVCGDNVMLRDRIEHLMELHVSQDSLLEQQPLELLDALSGKAHLNQIDCRIQMASILGPPTRPDSLGRLAHYEVLSVLGQGGFGIVVKAFDESLQRIVAIKILAPHLATTSPPRKRFLREARSAAAVRHEHVVQIHAVEEQPIPFMVMELIEGLNLQQQIDAIGPLEPAEVVRLGRQVALGLAAAHEKGLIHRDVKPANILLEMGDELHVKLTDFGLARTADDASLSQSGILAGTPMFMAPEQARGEPLDHRADLFSLGSVLYTMCVGHPPFRAPTTFAVLKRLVDDSPRPIRDAIPEVPDGLCQVIARLHAKNPKDRFGSAQEVEEALAGCLSHSMPMPPRSEPVHRTWWKRPGLAITGLLPLLVAAAWNEGWFDRPAQRNETPPAVTTVAEPASGLPADHSRSQQAASSPAPTQLDPAALAAVPSAISSWEQVVSSMPAKQQIQAVVARLEQDNPTFDASSIEHKIENGVVVSVRINPCDRLDDLTALRALSGLTDLRLSGNGAADLSPLKGMKLVTLETDGCPIKDLSPLAGMPLSSLNLWRFLTDDLSPLRGMRLVNVNLGGSPVKEISVLKGMPIESLCLNHTQVEDLSPLKGAPLRRFEFTDTKITDMSAVANSPIEFLGVGAAIADYSPLRTLPLKSLRLSYEPAHHAKLLRSIPTLKVINGQPAAQLLGNDGE